MGIEETVQQVKQQVLGSLEEHVYQQANAQNLVDTVLRTLVEGAVARLQVQMPGAASGVGALLGMFTPVASVVQSLGLDDEIADLIKRYGVDTALRDSVIRGITRYLQENGGHLMEVAVKAVVGKLTKG
jgi:hypothetical protein